MRARLVAGVWRHAGIGAARGLRVRSAGLHFVATIADGTLLLHPRAASARARASEARFSRRSPASRSMPPNCALKRLLGCAAISRASRPQPWRRLADHRAVHRPTSTCSREARTGAVASCRPPFTTRRRNPSGVRSTRTSPAICRGTCASSAARHRRFDLRLQLSQVELRSILPRRRVPGERSCRRPGASRLDELPGVRARSGRLDRREMIADCHAMRLRIPAFAKINLSLRFAAFGLTAITSSTRCFRPSSCTTCCRSRIPPARSTFAATIQPVRPTART